jgi:hypothetical protein
VVSVLLSAPAVHLSLLVAAAAVVVVLLLLLLLLLLVLVVVVVVVVVVVLVVVAVAAAAAAAAILVHLVHLVVTLQPQEVVRPPLVLMVGLQISTVLLLQQCSPTRLCETPALPPRQVAM